MSDFSEYYRNVIVNHALLGGAFTPPVALYIALFTSGTGLEANDPTGEVTAADYVRMPVSLSAPNSVAGLSNNSEAVIWEPALSDWAPIESEITHIALVDHVSNADWGVDVNVIMFDELTTPIAIVTDDILRIPIEGLEIQIT